MNAQIMHEYQTVGAQIGTVFHKIGRAGHAKPLRENMNGVCFGHRNKRRYVYAIDKISQRSDVLRVVYFSGRSYYRADSLEE